jgi:hypothetical protein
MAAVWAPVAMVLSFVSARRRRSSRTGPILLPQGT